MTWQPYALAAFSVLVLGALAGALALLGADRGMIAGAGAGIGLALLLLVFNEITTRLALREKRKFAALGHIYGGFFLRLVVLVVGFSLLWVTGAGNPVGFAVAFLAGVVLMLAWQVYRATQRLGARTA